jgi:predicted ATPase/class 3 adenylate cyclase
MQTCPNCGEENPDKFRLCGICGTALAPAAPAQEVRKTVTVVFSDLKGSTDLGERLDTESLREVLSVYFTEMQAVLERHGGTVEKFIGDAIMAVFGLPTLHEDDALRAVRAAHEMQEALARVNDRLEAGWGVRLENRTGVNTGEVVAGDVTAGQRLVTGDTVNTAARLEQNCPALEVLIGEPTYRLVKDAVEVEQVEPLELKGKAERVPAYRLISVRGGEAVTRRLDAPMVGRVRELDVLTAALDRAIAHRRPQLVTVFGTAGVGKSRLLHEFLARSAGHATALRGRCLSYGDGITFWPLAEVVRQAADITDDDPLDAARDKLATLVGDGATDVVERVGSAIGLSGATFPVQETFAAARRLFEILARERPLIVLVDDIHWAEGTFLELFRFVIDSPTESAVVLVCSSRPDLLEAHPEWGAEDEATKRIVLDPLSADESALVVENLLGTGDFDPAVRAKIVGSAEGNPLFVEQMLSMLIDDGMLHRDEQGHWVVTSDLGAVIVPPSISALLTARLDRLGPVERTAIERGAVIGQIFFQGAVEELSPEGVREQIEPSLQSLIRKELIRPGDSTFAGQEAFRFLHQLIRDAAYQGLLKRMRAELHERFVDWLERVASDRVIEYEEIRGYHLEQAYLIRSALGPLDGNGLALGRRGSEYLASAGHRALARGDMPAAANLLQRAAALLLPEDATRTRLLVESAEALIEIGEFTLADGLLLTASDEASARADQNLEKVASLVRLSLHYQTGKEGVDEHRIIEEVQQALEVLEAIGDHEGLARAWRLLTLVHWTALRYEAAEESARQMIEYARLGGNELMERRFLTSLAMCALYGPTPVSEAIRRCEELLDRTRGDRKSEAVMLCVLARLEAMQGRFDRARELYRKSRATLEELGWKLYSALTSLDSGPIEMLAGDPAAAERELRADFDALDRMGERNYISTTAGFLAEALYEQERYDEAEALSGFSQGTAAPDDLASQLHWRCVLGKVLARRGRFDEAEALVREAIKLIGETDERDSQGNALMDLAEVLLLAGRSQDALEAAKEAKGIFEAKGNVVSADAAARLVATLSPDEGPPAVVLEPA